MTDQLHLFKKLLEVELTDESRDDVFNHYLTKSRSIILGYCNVTELSVQYDPIITDFAVYLYKHRSSDGMNQVKQGERSVTFELGIPQHIRSALPYPRVQVGGY